MKVVAKRGFLGIEGRVRRRAEIDVSAARAEQLIKRGLVEPVGLQSAIVPSRRGASPSKKAAIAPQSSGRIILVTGCARSGTSLTTQILQALGCYLGDSRVVNDLYENTEIRQTILKPLIKANGGDPLGQGKFPDISALKPSPDLRARIESKLSGWHEPWAYKDAKISLVWPLFAAAFPEAIWVIVRREREQIIDSCIRTSFMKAHGDDREAWGKWVDDQEAQFTAMQSAGLNLIEVWPQSVIADAEAFRPVAEHCDLHWDPGAVTASISPDKWHG